MDGPYLIILIYFGLINYKTSYGIIEQNQISIEISQRIIESTVGLLFSNCTDIKNFLGVSFEQLNARNQPSASSTWINLPGSGDILWNHPMFNRNLPTEIVVHGFTQHSFAFEINVLLSSLIIKGNRNVILVDAFRLIGLWYMYSSTALKFIGNYLGTELIQLVSQGYDKSMIHLIGFSMGAHIAGFAGKLFKKETGESLPWITGLDPAGPCFFVSPSADGLDYTDADFVDVIHTNMGIWGTTKEIGHVDFYPNSGRNQPGRDSHIRAIYLYAESIFITNGFPAARCKSWHLFTLGGCSKNTKAFLGYEVSKKSHGRHYLITNGGVPYSKGYAGILDSRSNGFIN